MPELSLSPGAAALTATDALSLLCRRFRVRSLDLFGSTADGRFDPAHSDPDFLVTSEELPGAAYAAAYFGLRESLSELLERDVDQAPRLKQFFMRRAMGL